MSPVIEGKSIIISFCVSIVKHYFHCFIVLSVDLDETLHSLEEALGVESEYECPTIEFSPSW
jgi:hypothetical protein